MSIGEQRRGRVQPSLNLCLRLCNSSMLYQYAYVTCISESIARASIISHYV